VIRDLDWSYCVNIRDLGGLTTVDGAVTTTGAIVRADNVRRLTAEGWGRAREYGVRTILDLRSDRERRDDQQAPADFEVMMVSLFDDFDSDAAYRADLMRRVSGAHVREKYRALYSEALIRNAAEFGAAVAAIASAREGGVLTHCAGGKDRTGVLAALLLRLADVPISTIEEDYERSEHRLRPADGDQPRDQPDHSAPAELIGPIVQTIEDRHLSVEGYFLHAGATGAEIARVRERLRTS